MSSQTNIYIIYIYICIINIYDIYKIYIRHKVLLFSVNFENFEMKVIINQFLFNFPELLAQNLRKPENRGLDTCKTYMPNLKSSNSRIFPNHRQILLLVYFSSTEIECSLLTSTITWLSYQKIYTGSPDKEIFLSILVKVSRIFVFATSSLWLYVVF